jgi:aspartyl-tRNA(Asn)/glutamyl-tRNA(Gln) amidotransferase subunit C
MALIDRTTIDHVAGLASISLTDEEAARMARELAAIVAYVAELGAVDTSEVASEAPSVVQAWREDTLVPGLSHEEALSQAPEVLAEGFAVPTFVAPGGGVR